MIHEQIEQDLKSAMRAQAAERLSVLRLAKSALQNAAIAKSGAGSKLPDAEAVVVLRKQVKQRYDAIESFEKGARPELAEKERREIAVLNEYLPQPLNNAEIEELVRGAIAEVGATSKAQAGQVMKVASQKAGGRVDGKTLMQAIQGSLA